MGHLEQQIHNHVQINRSIFASYGMQAMILFRAFEDFYASGTQDTEVTKSLKSRCGLPRPTVK